MLQSIRVEHSDQHSSTAPNHPARFFIAHLTDLPTRRRIQFSTAVYKHYKYAMNTEILPEISNSYKFANNQTIFPNKTSPIIPNEIPTTNAATPNHNKRIMTMHDIRLTFYIISYSR